MSGRDMGMLRSSSHNLRLDFAFPVNATDLILMISGSLLCVSSNSKGAAVDG